MPVKLCLRDARPLALLALVAPIGPGALGQTVSLGGIVDAAPRYVKNSGSGSVKSLASGSLNTSRIVVRGSEDLGGGLTAGFWLEHGIALDTGNAASATQFWDRRSTVSLGSRQLGELRAGRDFIPSYLSWSRHDPFAYVGVGGSNNLVSAAPAGPIRSAFSTAPNTTTRSSNSIQWLMPPGWAGLEGGVMAAAGEGATAGNVQARVVGARIGWASRAFSVSAASTRTGTDDGGASKFADDTAGGIANFDVVRVSAAWRRFRHASAEQTNIIFGAWIPLGSGELKAAWNRADLRGRFGTTAIGANDAHQIAVGYVHALSKRTALYATAARIDNRGAATFAIPGGGSISGGGSSKGAETGIRHTF